jgi:hypothetical protein
MKTFEERYTAWIDQRLPENERVAFEKELEDLPGAERDRDEAVRLGQLLRTHGRAPSLSNAEFFGHQIAQRIDFTKSQATAARRGWWHWSIPRLVTAGAIALATAFVLYKTIVPPATSAPHVAQAASGEPYFAEVVDAWTDDPSMSVTTVYTPEDKVTVLWLAGLDYLPASYTLE